MKQPLCERKKGQLSFVLDKIEMHEFIKMYEFSWVGFTCGIHFGEKTISKWMTKEWQAHINLLPTFKILVRGWLIFFSTSLKRFIGIWINFGFLTLSISCLCIGSLFLIPLREKLDKAPIWVWLVELKVQFRSKKPLREIGNKLGECLEANLTFKDYGDEGGKSIGKYGY